MICVQNLTFVANPCLDFVVVRGDNADRIKLFSSFQTIAISTSSVNIYYSHPFAHLANVLQMDGWHYRSPIAIDEGI
jgi:hypothetical protein